jgi:hypothetical protein
VSISAAAKMIAGNAAGCASFFETLTMPSRVPAARLEAAEAAW